VRRVIYKYQFVDEVSVLEVPYGIVRHVGSEWVSDDHYQVPREIPTLWVEHLLNDDGTIYSTPRTALRFRFYATGESIDGSLDSFVGTAVCGRYVWHVFRVAG